MRIQETRDATDVVTWSRGPSPSLSSSSFPQSCALPYAMPCRLTRHRSVTPHSSGSYVDAAHRLRGAGAPAAGLAEAAGTAARRGRAGAPPRCCCCRLAPACAGCCDGCRIGAACIAAPSLSSSKAPLPPPPLKEGGLTPEEAPPPLRRENVRCGRPLSAGRARAASAPAPASSPALPSPLRLPFAASCAAAPPVVVRRASPVGTKAAPGRARARFGSCRSSTSATPPSRRSSSSCSIVPPPPAPAAGAAGSRPWELRLASPACCCP